MKTHHKTTHSPQAPILTALLILVLLPACLSGTERRERGGSHARPGYAGEASLEDASFDTLEDTSLELALPSPLHMDLSTITSEVMEPPVWGGSITSEVIVERSI